MIITWLSQHYIELLGAVAGIVYLYFSVNRIIWLWPFGILTSLLYLWVFFSARLYADMSLQVYYFFISFYGWYYWIYGKKKEEKELKITFLNRKTFLLSLAIIVVLTCTGGFFLKEFTDSSLPFADAFTTASGIVATWMLARKILENWLFWIFIDLFSMGMYIYKALYPTVALYLVYSVIAWVGYKNWKKDISS